MAITTYNLYKVPLKNVKWTIMFMNAVRHLLTAGEVKQEFLTCAEADTETGSGN